MFQNDLQQILQIIRQTAPQSPAQVLYQLSYNPVRGVIVGANPQFLTVLDPRRPLAQFQSPSQYAYVKEARQQQSLLQTPLNVHQVLSRGDDVVVAGNTFVDTIDLRTLRGTSVLSQQLPFIPQITRYGVSVLQNDFLTQLMGPQLSQTPVSRLFSATLSGQLLPGMRCACAADGCLRVYGLDAVRSLNRQTIDCK